MWIFSTIGFFSLTQSKHEPGKMHFRARERVDLVNLCDRFFIDRASIVETPQADYRYRLVMPPLQAIQIVTTLATDIDYSNFKDAVHRNPTQARKGGAYMRVWSTMHALQPPRDPMEGYPLLWERETADPDGFSGVLRNPKARRPATKRAVAVQKAAEKCVNCRKPMGAHIAGDTCPHRKTRPATRFVANSELDALSREAVEDLLARMGWLKIANRALWRTDKRGLKVHTQDGLSWRDAASMEGITFNFNSAHVA